MIKNDLNNLSKSYLYNDLFFSDDSIEETPSDDLMDYKTDETISSLENNMSEELEKKIDEYEDFILDLRNDVDFYTRMEMLLLEKSEDLDKKIDILFEQKNIQEKEIRMHLGNDLGREELEEKINDCKLDMEELIEDVRLYTETTKNLFVINQLLNKKINILFELNNTLDK